MNTFACADRQAYEHYRSVVLPRQEDMDAEIIRRYVAQGRFSTRCFCHACQMPCAMAVLPNKESEQYILPVSQWRESLQCAQCRMTNRQRLMAYLLREACAKAGPLDIYLMEHLSPLKDWCCRTFASHRWMTSEYAGPGFQPGTVVGGIRHEDSERLSFADASFDLLVNCEVLEHVSDPLRALREMHRVLRPGGALLMSTPFDARAEHNLTRARWREDGSIVYLEEPMYHGDPLSAQGALAVTDFGWELLEQMRQAGFRDARVACYWSPEEGHWGELPVFHATA